MSDEETDGGLGSPATMWSVVNPRLVLATSGLLPFGFLLAYLHAWENALFLIGGGTLALCDVLWRAHRLARRINEAKPDSAEGLSREVAD